MKDNEIRGIVLRAFYERRQDGPIPWDGTNIPADVDAGDFYRIAEQLSQQALLDWNGCADGMGKIVAGLGQISADGVDVIEGAVKSPISITFDHRQTVSITGSNNIVGDHNSIIVDQINTAINKSIFSAPEKAEAKSLWQKVSENKLLNTVLGSAADAATKHALEAVK